MERPHARVPGRGSLSRANDVITNPRFAVSWLVA